MKSNHHLSHDRTNKVYGSIPGLMLQTDLHRIKSVNMHAKKFVTSTQE